MIILIASTLLFAWVIGRALSYNNNPDASEVFLGSMLGFLIGAMLSTGIGLFVPQKPVEVDRIKLVALKDNITTQGSFFLGSGVVDGVHKYFYYKENGHGGFLIGSIDSSGVPIYEDVDSDPYISVLHHEFVDKKFNAIAIPNLNEFYAFHIPKNSITRDFKLDLE